MRFNLKWLAVLAGLFILVGGGTWWLGQAEAEQSPTVLSIANAATIFDPIRSQLGESQVPLRLPTYIPAHGQAETTGDVPPVSANLTSRESGRYEVILGYSPDCEGGSVCRLGTVTGQMKPTEPIAAQFNESDYLYSDEHRSDEPMGSVTLANNIRGEFLPWRCATSCEDAQIVWEEGNYRYSVGIKMGDRASLVEMANSAIESGR